MLHSIRTYKISQKNLANSTIIAVFKRVHLIKYDIYSWTNYLKKNLRKVDYKPILNISSTGSIYWKSAIRNLRTTERKYSARIKAIKIRTKEKQSKSFKESTVYGSLSNTRDPSNNGFIHQEFPCWIYHYKTILHSRTVPNKISQWFIFHVP